ncbi:transposase [Embleya sp. NBC_00896]|uniref:transposase n=1 Tax=Embleya sp. NBC_00896 TaxID=2975961 RepID=UPI002F91534A|nr:transposase [Embleya sp. NBC_00896]
MADAESEAVRPLLPVRRGWRARGGQPEGYRHRQMLGAVRYLLGNGVKWRAIPADFPGWDRVYALPSVEQINFIFVGRGRAAGLRSARVRAWGGG